MIILDSDVLIWILRGKEEIKGKLEQIINETNGKVFITPIQIAEIYSGLRKNEILDTELFLDSFNEITINNKIGKIAGNFMNKYMKSHNLLLPDAIMAACSKFSGYRLWTLNTKYYPMLTKKDFLS